MAQPKMCFSEKECNAIENGPCSNPQHYDHIMVATLVLTSGPVQEHIQAEPLRFAAQHTACDTATAQQQAVAATADARVLYTTAGSNDRAMP
eukprot:2530-Heterococcus_DN1.PRE.4